MSYLRARSAKRYCAALWALLRRVVPVRVFLLRFVFTIDEHWITRRVHERWRILLMNHEPHSELISATVAPATSTHKHKHEVKIEEESTARGRLVAV